MLNHTGLVTTALGLVLVGPTASSALLGQEAVDHDPLTKAWFDTVQSIGTLEGLTTQLQTGHAGAVQNLLRNTEEPMGDPAQRQQRIDELQLEIDRMRSELEIMRLNVQRPAAAEQGTATAAEPEPESNLPRIEARTVGMTADERRAMIHGGEPEPVDEVAAQLAAARARVLAKVEGASPGATADDAWTPPADTSSVGTGQPQTPPAGQPEPRTPLVTGSRLGPTDPAVIDAMPTTLVLGPTGAGAPRPGTAPAGDVAPTGSGRPLTIDPNAPPAGGASTPRAGTGSVADRVAAAQAELEAAAQADLRARVAGAYSADTVLQGRAAYFAGDYGRAIETLAPITDDARAVYWTGRTYEKLDRATDAMRCYESVIAMPDAGDMASRAQLDLDFLRWKWEHSEGFEAIRSATQGTGSTGQ